MKAKAFCLLLALLCCGFTRTIYVAVTAFDSAGLESDYSSELAYSFPAGGTNKPPSITVGWTAETDPSVIGYHVYWGFKSRDYTSMGSTVSNQFTIDLTPPPAPPATNIFVFSHPGGLLFAPCLDCEFFPTNNPLHLTNPAGSFFVRGLGFTNSVTFSKQ